MPRRKLCNQCKHPWTREGLVPFDAKCEQCEAHLHVCLNCALHDALAKKGCRHEAGEPGPSPSSKNFCEVFVFRESFDLTAEEEKMDRKSAEKKWNDLFRDS